MNEEHAIACVIQAMYEMISGPAGPRDWTKQEEIFHPAARQMRTGVDADGRPWIKIMSLEQYRQDTAPFFAANAFYEVETARRIDVFGAMAQVWSVYEARGSPGDSVPERRGINSIQLFRDAGGHWRIVSMIWDNERERVVAPLFLSPQPVAALQHGPARPAQREGDHA
jgi:hypothetical protein